MIGILYYCWLPALYFVITLFVIFAEPGDPKLYDASWRFWALLSTVTIFAHIIIYKLDKLSNNLERLNKKL